MSLLEELKKPFDPKVVHWRIGRKTKSQDKGLALAYIDARDVMKRLDDVVGMENWQDSYQETQSGRVICTLSINIDGNWIAKSDGAGATDFEGEKGGISDAFKRAAVKFGIGRYLYYLEAKYYPIDQYGNFTSKIPLPDWAHPKPSFDYMEAVRDNIEEIYQAKLAIANNDIEAARACVNDIPKEIADGLWIAPSKGGIWTTEERTRLTNGE